MNKKIKITSTIFFILILMAYVYRVYLVNNDAPNLRNYSKEIIGKEFNAFSGKLTVENIDIIENRENLKLDNNNKKYISSNDEKYIKIIYTAKNINERSGLEIKLNNHGYIFYDGLPFSKKIDKNKYEYIIPFPKNKKTNDMKIFFDNVKYNELEHHYIEIKEK